MATELQLAAVTPEQFKKENPNAYELIVREAVSEKDEQIAEMEEKVKDMSTLEELLAKVRKTLNIADDADPLAALMALTEKVGEFAGDLRDKLLSKELLKRIPGDTPEAKRSRSLVLRLMPQAEMTAKVADAKDEDAAEKIVSEMVETAFNDDDEVKLLIGEMAPASVRRRDEFRGGSGSGTENDGDGNKGDLKDNAYVTEEVTHV